MREKANHTIPHRKFVDRVMRTAAETDRNQGEVIFSPFLVPMKLPHVQKFFFIGAFLISKITSA